MREEGGGRGGRGEGEGEGGGGRKRREEHGWKDGHMCIYTQCMHTHLASEAK